jgi:hypothetical protein
MIAAATEQGFYLAELARLVFVASPIALILIGLTFLRRKEPTQIVFGMQVTAGIWLALAVANPILDGSSHGLFGANKENSIERLRLYLSIMGVTGTLQTLSFLFFAILFLIYCRQRISKDDLI